MPFLSQCLTGSTETLGRPSLNPLAIRRSFFLGSPGSVARALLGKLLVSRMQGEELICRITETEAYFGLGDPAAHTFAGRTARTAVLFGPPGHAYVYFIYGTHFCLNIACEPEGQAGCVLLRAGEPLVGLETMARLRGLPSNAKPSLLTAGPGRLCQALGITQAECNGLDMVDLSSRLHVADDGHPPPPIATTTRIGITKEADRLARFYIAGSAFISKGRSATPGKVPSV